MRKFHLDRVWWLVSPGNPLKAQGPAPLERRMEACRGVAQHPRIVVSDLETRLGTRYTAETLGKLFEIYADVNFVWLMGADNLSSFHRWDRWDWIMENVPIGVMSRPGDQIAAGLEIRARGDWVR